VHLGKLIAAHRIKAFLAFMENSLRLLVMFREVSL
jgi:hypothetical protein